jgi:Amt family ammonium transporter
VGAIVLGVVASILCYFFVAVVKHKMGYDDSLDVFGIHGIGGIVGALGTAIVDRAAFGGIGYSEAALGAQIWTQFLGVVVTILWCGIASAILYKIVDVLVGLRVREEDERQGLDIASHGERAYSM